MMSIYFEENMPCNLFVDYNKIIPYGKNEISLEIL